METRSVEVPVAPAQERWVSWPVHWSAVWVGALAALATLVVFGLAGVALGSHLVKEPGPVVDWKKFGFGMLAFSVFSSFLSFVVGGWVAGKIVGFRRSEPAILHGAIVFLVAVPLLLLFVGAGAGSFLGGWYGGMTPAWAPAPDVAIYQKYIESGDYKTIDEVKARVTRNSALGAVTALLLGLMGSVIGGWMASGEPMTFTYHRTRQALGGTRAGDTHPVNQEIAIPS